MLRPDFAQVFDHLTRRSARYSLNTNGTADHARDRAAHDASGNKMVALYGATAAMHDHVTRTPGSYETHMEGFARLREAGAGFTVQVIPLRDNCPRACGDGGARHDAQSSLAHRGAVALPRLPTATARRNAEIAAQRLDPADAVALDPPSPVLRAAGGVGRCRRRLRPLRAAAARRVRRSAAPSTSTRYGGLSVCLHVKDPALRYDLRAGDFREGWEEFIPSLAARIGGGDEHAAACGACTRRDDCRWCDVYGYLEHRRHGARIDYLCEVAAETERARARVDREHRRSYRIAGLTVQVESELAISAATFDEKFERFACDPAEAPDVVIQHAFDVEGLQLGDLGEPVFRRVPWSVHRVGRSWVYVGIVGEPSGGYPADADVDDEGYDDDLVVVDEPPHQVVVCSEDHTRVRVHHDAVARHKWRQGGLHALTMMPTDQIVLSRVLADRGGCYVHSGGVVLDGQGLVFVGHSGAGKSTAMRQLRGARRGPLRRSQHPHAERWPGDGPRHLEPR